MNGDAVKIPQPVAATVYANVPVDTAMLATNLYGPTTQLAAPAATHIPLIAPAAGPQPTHHQALQVAPGPGQHQSLIAHTAAAHSLQPTLQTVQAAAAAAAVAAATPQAPPPHQLQGHPQQPPHIQYAHQAPIAAATGQGPTVTTTTIDNTEYTVMNGTIAQDGTVVCYSQDDLPVGMSVGVGPPPPGANNLVAVDQMSGTPVTAATAQQHSALAQHHVILTNVPPPPQQQQQQQTVTQQQHHHQTQPSQQQVVGNNNNNSNVNNMANSSNVSSNSSAGNAGSGGDSVPMSLEQLKQSLATQLEYYFSRLVLCSQII